MFVDLFFFFWMKAHSDADLNLWSGGLQLQATKKRGCLLTTIPTLLGFDFTRMATCPQLKQKCFRELGISRNYSQAFGYLPTFVLPIVTPTIALSRTRGCSLRHAESHAIAPSNPP